MEKVPKSYAIVKANEHMIKSCDYLICYNKCYAGKTRDFVEMALRREKRGLFHIENLANYENAVLPAKGAAAVVTSPARARTDAAGRPALRTGNHDKAVFVRSCVRQQDCGVAPLSQRTALEHAQSEQTLQFPEKLPGLFSGCLRQFG